MRRLLPAPRVPQLPLLFYHAHRVRLPQLGLSFRIGQLALTASHLIPALLPLKVLATL